MDENAATRLSGRVPGFTSWLAAVVVTVSVVDAVAVVAFRVTGGTVQATPVGSPEHAKLIVPLNPLTAITDTLIVPELPGLGTVTTAFTGSGPGYVTVLRYTAAQDVGHLGV